jgi:hypothetical protein
MWRSTDEAESNATIRHPLAELNPLLVKLAHALLDKFAWALWSC